MKQIAYFFFWLVPFGSSFGQSVTLQPNFFQLPRLAANPACTVPNKGKMIFNTNLNKVLYCNGSVWIDPESGGEARITPAFWVYNTGSQVVRTDFELLTFISRNFDLTNSFNLDNAPTDPNTFVSPDNGVYLINFDGKLDLSGFSPAASTQITFRLTISTTSSFNSYHFIFPIGDNSADNYIHLSKILKLPQNAKVRILVNIQNAPTFGALKIEDAYFSGHLASWY